MPTTGKLYGGEFNARDRNNPRTIIANWVPNGASVLEIGPGDGVISRWLKQTKHCRTIGVEFALEAACIAQDAFDELIIGSIENEPIVTQIRSYGPFDTVIFADVLEHLRDPWQVLRQMQPLLSSHGRVLLSVPNIAHWTARLNLLFGRFDYADGYLMDRTHLRWFTWHSARQMAQIAGYHIVEEASVFKPRFARLLPTLNGFQIVLNLAPADPVQGV
jgi:2-polyprenyl-3-methyl-5-hydroxy-6-metoxy-1,4-benzoquinol methylase